MNVPSLTGVRGIAALWVVFFHIQSFGGELGINAAYGLPVLRVGWAGVDLFFVLSGFVLMLSHEQDFPRLRWPPLLRFAWLRFFRIYPLATVVLLLILALTLVDREFAAAWSPRSVPPNFTVSSFFRTLFLATRWWSPTDGDWNQPVWSLSVEILGYVAFPFIAVVATRISNRWVLVMLALCCLAFPTVYAYFYASKMFNDDIFWGAGVRMAGAFTGGIVLARLHRMTPENWRGMQGRAADFGIAGLLVVLLLAPPSGYGLITLCFGAIVYGLAADRGAANWLFSRPLAVWLGRISFPLYLIHVMALSWLRYSLYRDDGSLAERLGGLVLYLVFVFALAWLLHLYVERPTHRFARQAFPANPKTEGALAGRAANG
jgi:peptidoglycan/LPS O-acetylase OafA/YrhL